MTKKQTLVQFSTLSSDNVNKSLLVQGGVSRNLFRTDKPRRGCAFSNWLLWLRAGTASIFGALKCSVPRESRFPTHHRCPLVFCCPICGLFQLASQCQPFLFAGYLFTQTESEINKQWPCHLCNIYNEYCVINWYMKYAIEYSIFIFLQVFTHPKKKKKNLSWHANLNVSNHIVASWKNLMSFCVWWMPQLFLEKVVFDIYICWVSYG